MTTSGHAATPPSPTRTQDRSLAPDLARGLMLLLIALAHAPAFVGDWERGPVALNAAAEFTRSLVAENQARSMFVFLFGYGLGQLVHRRLAGGDRWPEVRRLLRRRSVWLVAIGFAHAVLLVPLDIIAVYGLALLLLAPLVRARDAVLWWTTALTLPLATVVIAWQSVVAQDADAAGSPITMARFMEPDYASHILSVMPSWLVETAVSVVVVVPGMAVGIWAARRRILDEPERHAAALRRAAVLLLGAALAGRLPMALLAVGVWTAPSTAAVWAAATAHTFTGHLGGIGMAAAVGLAATGLGRGRLTTAMAALGQRSMTFYLFQSVVWVALFYPFALGLHDDMGFAGACAVAVALWAVSVLLAEWMRRADYRGPFEALVRRASYGRPAPTPVE
ncbi:DUF418 domain-containing protein (plasmid) [Streptomonospora nanhaiensis]|uniref:DUF418 domain-containing protein n=1 Tax=Streptomonospora nanhaiensis TaxID=1323731 RepID=A0ABY6YZ21_9ACTN|nr:DUF418 domain-containing protein [Streptomonospora nanhaiensis]WAE76835.1 DUF418 domain-containing protein [Streptomonospora nanhaiensis]